MDYDSDRSYDDAFHEDRVHEEQIPPSDNEVEIFDDQWNDGAAVDTGGIQMKHSVEHRPSSPRRLSVSGISRRTTEETFANYFGKFGKVVDSVIVKKKKTRKTKRYGFVTFSDSAVADKVLEEKHVIDKRKVKLKRGVRDISKTRQISFRGYDDASNHHRVHEEQIPPVDNEIEIFDDQRNDGAAVDTGGMQMKQHSVEHRSSSPVELFVKGIWKGATEETFANYFGKFGEVLDSVIAKNKRTGKPKGHGFVTFADSAVADKVLEEEHVIDNKKITLKRRVPRDVSKTRQISVRVLSPPPLEEDELKNYFCQYGDIIKHEIMYDHTGRSKGFGYVTFQTGDSVDKLFSDGKIHNLGDKQVEIRREGQPKKTGKDNSFQSYGVSGKNDQEDCYVGEANEDYNMYSGYGSYGPYIRNSMVTAAGFYGGGGAYGYGGPMLNMGYGGQMWNLGYGVGPYSHMGGGPGGYGANAYGGGNSGSSSGRRNRTNGSKPVRYHPYRK